MKKPKILTDGNLSEIIDYVEWLEYQLKDPDRLNTRLVRTRIENKITELRRELTHAKYLGARTDCERAVEELKRAIIELREVIS